VALLLGPLAPAALAAEVLQVRSSTLLQVGDRNRSYGVELACLAVAADDAEAATAWLRRALPRHTRINLRPAGSHDGLLVARVNRLDDGLDPAAGLVGAGLATTSSPSCP
jgi:hypothetical protein